MQRYQITIDGFNIKCFNYGIYVTGGVIMKLKITAKNIKLTEAIKTYSQTKINKLDKFFDDGAWVELVISVDKKINQKAEMTLHAAKKKFTAKAIEENLYKAIDGALLKVESQIRKAKGKIQSKRVSNTAPKEDLSAYYSAMINPQNEVRFSVIKQVEVSPMSAEDAALEMEKLGYTFWMFLDEDTKQINLIFKRLDGSYGLIQPIKAK